MMHFVCFIYILTLQGALICSGSAAPAPNEVISPTVLGALRAAKYSVDLSEDAEGRSVAIIRSDAGTTRFTWEQCATVDDAYQKAMKAFSLVSAGVKFVSRDPKQTTLLHRQFAHANKGATFLKLESKSGFQEENLRKTIEIIIAAWP